MKLDQATIDAVFAAASTARFTHTNLGHRAHVGHAGYHYTVEIPSGYLAEIVYVSGYGGVEDVQGAHATLKQHHLLMAAANR